MKKILAVSALMIVAALPVAFQPDIKPLGTSYNAAVTMSAWTW